jgi:hypothetical protein
MAMWERDMCALAGAPANRAIVPAGAQFFRPRQQFSVSASHLLLPITMSMRPNSSFTFVSRVSRLSRSSLSFPSFPSFPPFQWHT